MRCKIKDLIIVYLLFSLAGGLIASGLSDKSFDDKKEPCITITDSYGCKIIENGKVKLPGLLDSIFASFKNLVANKRYSIHLVRSDGKEINRFYKISDSNCEIPKFALWQDWKVKYKDRVIKINPEFLNYEYSCVLKQEGKPGPILETPIPILKKKGFIYSSDEEENPKNTFIKGEDAVYVTGKNFYSKGNKERKSYIYVVKDRPSWRKGFMLERYLVKKLDIILRGNELNFKKKIYSKRNHLKIGNYDIIVNDNPFDRIDEDFLIDSSDGVGFEVVDRAELKKEDIIRDLTCQVPVLLISGDGVELPQPVYKDYFAPVEEVWVALDSCYHEFKQGKARLYIINHQHLSNKTPLNDASGGYEEVFLQHRSGKFFYKRVWDKPEAPKAEEGNRDKKYDVVVDLDNDGLYDKGSDILDSSKKGGFFVPKDWVCLDSISFKHPGRATSYNAINIRLHESKNDPGNEWSWDWQRGEPAYPAAYIAKSRFMVHAKFKANDTVFRAKIKAYKRSGHLADLKSTYIYFKKINKISRKEERFQSIRYSPRKIRSFYQVWDWYLLRIKRRKKIQRYSHEHIATTMNKIYIILNEPLHPWGVDEERAPWLRVLEIACREAKGAASPKAAAAKITRFLYNNKKVGADYKSDSTQYSANGTSSVKSNFLLTKFLNKIPGVGEVNCYDMGKALVIFANVLGCGLDLMYFKSPIKPKRVRLVGNDSDKNDEVTFKNHAFTAIGNKIYDATIKEKRRGINLFSPGFCWITGVSLGKYEKRLVGKGKPTYPEVVEFEIEEKSTKKDFP